MFGLSVVRLRKNHSPRENNNSMEHFNAIITYWWFNRNRLRSRFSSSSSISNDSSMSSHASSTDMDDIVHNVHCSTSAATNNVNKLVSRKRSITYEQDEDNRFVASVFPKENDHETGKAYPLRFFAYSEDGHVEHCVKIHMRQDEGNVTVDHLAPSNSATDLLRLAKNPYYVRTLGSLLRSDCVLPYTTHIQHMSDRINARLSTTGLESSQPSSATSVNSDWHECESYCFLPPVDDSSSPLLCSRWPIYGHHMDVGLGLNRSISSKSQVTGRVMARRNSLELDHMILFAFLLIEIPCDDTTIAMSAMKTSFAASFIKSFLREGSSVYISWVPSLTSRIVSLLQKKNIRKEIDINQVNMEQIYDAVLILSPAAARQIQVQYAYFIATLAGILQQEPQKLLQLTLTWKECQSSV